VAWSILLAGLVLRVVFVRATHWPPPIFDPADYDRHAVSLANGHGYPMSLISGPGDPTAMRMPLYPTFLAAVYKLFGHSIGAARIAQTLLGTATVGLVGLIAYRLFGRRVGLAALAIAAVFPPLIVLEGSLMSENLLVPLELAALACALEHRRSSRRYRWAVAAGVLTALAMLTRPNAIVLLLALGIGIWTARPRARLATLAFLTAAAVVFAPWPIRNALTLHAFVPLSTEGGLVATGIYNDYSRTRIHAEPGRWQQPWRYPNASRPIWREKQLTEPQMDAKLRSTALRYVRGHPLYPLEVGFWNSLRLLHVEDGYPAWARNLISLPAGPAELAMYAFFPVLLLALAGALVARRAPPFVWLVPALMWLSVVFFTSEPRSRAPIDPFFVVLAAAGAIALLDRVRAGAALRRPVAVTSRPA
jgi:4-amino-4-deoxy-L-arabinose transferase-like glycosyltransferase